MFFVRKVRKNNPRIVSATLMGGLGNRLFAVGAAVGYAKTHNRRFVLCKQFNHTNTQRGHEDYSESVFARVEVTQSEPKHIISEAPTNAFTYSPLESSEASHVHLHGYFQDIRYFQHAEQDVVNKLCLPPIPEISNTCFIHIRRCDYLHYQEHNVDLYSHYLPRAIDHVLTQSRKPEFRIFSDDIDWCQRKLKLRGINATISPQTNPVHAMCEMAGCSIGGICWNSSFSWWSAYLGYNPTKLIIFPSSWYGDARFKVTIQFPGSVILPTEAA